MASRLLRRQVMTLTDAAAARVRELTEAAGKPVAGLRVGVKNGGCAGMSYTMELAESASPARRGRRGQGRQAADRPEGGAVPARLADGFQGRPPVGELRLLQSQRDLGLRLRRKRRDHAGEPRGARRAGLNLQWTRALKALFEPFGRSLSSACSAAHGVYAEGLCFAIEFGGEVFLKVDAQSQPTFPPPAPRHSSTSRGASRCDVLLAPSGDRP